MAEQTVNVDVGSQKDKRLAENEGGADGVKGCNVHTANAGQRLFTSPLGRGQAPVTQNIKFHKYKGRVSCSFLNLKPDRTPHYFSIQSNEICKVLYSVYTSR
jgi:hypothetical protein